MRRGTAVKDRRLVSATPPSSSLAILRSVPRSPVKTPSTVSKLEFDVSSVTRWRVFVR